MKLTGWTIWASYYFILFFKLVFGVSDIHTNKCSNCRCILYVCFFFKNEMRPRCYLFWDWDSDEFEIRTTVLGNLIRLNLIGWSLLIERMAKTGERIVWLVMNQTPSHCFVTAWQYFRTMLGLVDFFLFLITPLIQFVKKIVLNWHWYFNVKTEEHTFKKK